MSGTASLSSADDDPLAPLLVAFLNGDPRARVELYDRLQEPLFRAARHLVPGNLAEDLVQQFWLLLLRRRPKSFNPDRITAKRYIRLLLRTAARDTFALYTPPGQRTRTRKRSNEQCGGRTPALSLDELVNVGEAQEVTTLGDLIPEPSNPFAKVNEELEAQWLLERAHKMVTEPVFRALKYVYEDEVGLAEAAQLAGISRFQLRRGILQLRWQLPMAV